MTVLNVEDLYNVRYKDVSKVILQSNTLWGIKKQSLGDMSNIILRELYDGPQDPTS